jgi:hypothetical protein
LSARFSGNAGGTTENFFALSLKLRAFFLASAHSIVEADAHIGPAEQTAFTEIYGEFAASQRADVGIDPYEQVRNCIRIRLRFPLKQLHSAGQSRGPSLPTHSFLERSAYDLPV